MPVQLGRQTTFGQISLQIHLLVRFHKDSAISATMISDIQTRATHWHKTLLHSRYIHTLCPSRLQGMRQQKSCPIYFSTSKIQAATSPRQIKRTMVIQYSIKMELSLRL